MPCFIFHSNKVFYNKDSKSESQKILSVLKVQLGEKESTLIQSRKEVSLSLTQRLPDSR